MVIGYKDDNDIDIVCQNLVNHHMILISFVMIVEND